MIKRASCSDSFTWGVLAVIYNSKFGSEKAEGKGKGIPDRGRSDREGSIAVALRSRKRRDENLKG